MASSPELGGNNGTVINQLLFYFTPLAETKCLQPDKLSNGKSIVNVDDVEISALSCVAIMVSKALFIMTITVRA